MHRKNQPLYLSLLSLDTTHGAAMEYCWTTSVSEFQLTAAGTPFVGAASVSRPLDAGQAYNNTSYSRRLTERDMSPKPLSVPFQSGAAMHSFRLP